MQGTWRRYLPGAPGPIGRGREPHLNLPEDVTTPRGTRGQWEAVRVRGGAGSRGRAHGARWRSRAATAGEGEASGGRGRRLPEASRRTLLPPAWCPPLARRRRRDVRGGAAAVARGRGVQSPTLPPAAAVSVGGMAAARGSGRASAPRLLLLLLLPLLWAPARVRAVPDEDLSHRNKEPPAPAQQLQPQPVAVQGPEPPRAEVSRTEWAGPGRVPGWRPPGARARPGAAGGGGEPAGRVFGVGPGLSGPVCQGKAGGAPLWSLSSGDGDAAARGPAGRM